MVSADGWPDRIQLDLLNVFRARLSHKGSMTMLQLSKYPALILAVKHVSVRMR